MSDKYKGPFRVKYEHEGEGFGVWDENFRRVPAEEVERLLNTIPAGGGAVAIVLAEVERATAKFPTWPTDPLHAVAVLGEEFGELTKAALQLTYEPHKTSMDEVREEAIQTAAMALRFVASLDRYQFVRGEQHKQEPVAMDVLEYEEGDSLHSPPVRAEPVAFGLFNGPVSREGFVDAYFEKHDADLNVAAAVRDHGPEWAKRLSIAPLYTHPEQAK